MVEGLRISRIDSETRAVTHDLTELTVMPGGIDTHVHIGWHFVPGRPDAPSPSRGGESPAGDADAVRSEKCQTLMCGITTVQSLGARQDADLRNWIPWNTTPLIQRTHK